MIQRILAVALSAGLALAPAPTPGDGLSQSLGTDQAEASGTAVLEQGHVDIGPRFRDGQWTVQVHDDSVVPPVWRPLEQTVLRVRDTARRPIPDDPAYAFLGQPAGTEVYVVPQTQDPEVVWVGWNTQDPAVMQAISRGVTMSLRAVQGPGPLTVYLQAGNLGAPQVLWSTAEPYPQPMWVETNTHTHASWVFGAPGAYLVAVTVAADLADGSSVTTDAVLRFVVGDGTDPGDALAGTLSVPPIAASAAPAAAEPGAGRSWVLPALGAGAAVVLAGLVAVPLRARAVRRRAEQQHAGDKP